MDAPESVMVKALVVERDVDTVFDFFTDISNWESGGALKNTKKKDDGTWLADTPLGQANITLRPNKEFGIFDHVFVSGGAEWNVYCRVTPNRSGSTVTWMFIKPDNMSKIEFENQLGARFDSELEGYKEALLSSGRL